VFVRLSGELYYVVQQWREVERNGEKWREVERSGEKWREVERSGEKWRYETAECSTTGKTLKP
jgi:hypothetical protein